MLEDSMSVHLINQTTTPALQQAATGRFRRWIGAAMDRWQRHRMVGILQGLNDRTLTDIGLHRSDIPAVVATFSRAELAMTPVARPAPLVDNTPQTLMKAA
jgi:uncharacterized protein YjiS (DUF1127 family)